MTRDASFDFESESSKFFRDDARGALFPIRELRVHVKIAALFDQFGAHRFGHLRDMRVAGLQGRSACEVAIRAHLRDRPKREHKSECNSDDDPLFHYDSPK